MKKISLADLSESVRSFIDEAFAAEGVVIADESGRLRGGIIPYGKATPEEIEQANADLERLRKKVGQAMKRQGISEEDIDRVLLEDD